MENIFQHEKSGNTWTEFVSGASVAFKYHLVSYLLLNAIFWLSWISYGQSINQSNQILWPLYPMLFGGAALFFHFLAAYILPENLTKQANTNSSNRI